MAVIEVDLRRDDCVDVMEGVEGGAPGPKLLTVRQGHGRSLTVLCDFLRAQGFLVAAARDASGLKTPVGPLEHHHVALVVRSRVDRWLAAAWLKHLAAVSPRRHLVVWVPSVTRGQTVPGTLGRGSARGTISPAPWRQSCPVDDVGRLARLMADVNLERADAWLSALVVGAALTGAPLADGVLRLAVWLRVWQRRYEEAAMASERIRHGPSRLLVGAVVRAAASGRTLVLVRPSSSPEPAVRWIHGDRTMYLLTAIPNLLHRLANADDELCALRSAGAWALEQCGSGGGVAFVDAGDGRVAAMVGWGGHGPGEADRLFASRVELAERRDCAGRTLAVAPVREAGVRIGSVLVSGPSARGATVVEAADTLALLCASPLRLRLDQMAILRRGRELLPELIGDSPAAVAVREAVARVAATPFPVVVEGESGTGKELVARALHRLSPRRDRRFAAVNCAAISDELLEAELFGHSRGAFTGAVSPRVGLFEDAHGGTLFLDEVAELSARAQAKLLRALQEREVRRVGEDLARPVDVRVVAASNRCLSDACEGGGFRDDLRFRLAVVRIHLAPLRERAEDVAPLARAFWARVMSDVGKHAVLGADALARLAAHGWPGNVRELQNVVAGLSLVAPDRGRVRARHVDLVLATSGASPHAPPMSLARARHVCEQRTVSAALARHAGRRTAAARELGITRQGLAKIIRRLRAASMAAEGVA